MCQLAEPLSIMLSIMRQNTINGIFLIISQISLTISFITSFCQIFTFCLLKQFRANRPIGPSFKVLIKKRFIIPYKPPRL